MYAYIESGGKQYKVASGDKVKVDKIDAESGSELNIDTVLAVIDGDKTVFGKPYVDKASVSAEVVSTEQQKKVMVFKQLTRKNSRKLRGHRQQLTTLLIKDIKGV